MIPLFRIFLTEKFISDTIFMIQAILKVKTSISRYMQRYNLKTIRSGAIPLFSLYNPLLILFFVIQGHPQYQNVNVNFTNTKII